MKFGPPKTFLLRPDSPVFLLHSANISICSLVVRFRHLAPIFACPRPNVEISRTTSNDKFLVAFLNLTFVRRDCGIGDTNVKFTPLGPKTSGPRPAHQNRGVLAVPHFTKKADTNGSKSALCAAVPLLVFPLLVFPLLVLIVIRSRRLRHAR